MAKEKVFLNVARVMAHLTQEQAADKLYVAKSTLVRWEKDPSKVQAWAQAKICELYGMKIVDIKWKKEEEEAAEEEAA